MSDLSQVSVIIRTRNEERWIGHCIQSVIDLIKNHEIILIDDSSNDETIKIVRHFIKDPNLKAENNPNYTNINIYHIEDYTPGKALNLGIQKANNEICLFISAHCILKGFNHSKHIADLENNVCIFGKQIPIWNGKRILSRYIWSHFIDKSVENMYSNLEERYFLHNAVSIYKKTTLIENPFDENLQHKEDRYWANKIIKENKKILYDPELLVHHHYTSDGSTWKGLA